MLTFSSGKFALLIPISPTLEIYGSLFIKFANGVKLPATTS